MDSTFNNKKNALSSLVTSMISQINTAIPVRVTAVNIQKKTVNVLSMIDQKDLQGKLSKVGPMNNIPYIRLQGGTYGILCDPAVGDVGLVVFCSRDISNIENSSLPNSNRTYSRSDGVYIASLLMDDPETYLKIEQDKISLDTKDYNLESQTTQINSKQTISITSQAITITAPIVNLNSEIVTVTGQVIAKEVIANGISLTKHIHGNGNNGQNTLPPKVKA